MPLAMLVTDLDRTLLRSDKTISDQTSIVLNSCRALGIKTVFATARPKHRVDMLGLSQLADVIITDNGAASYLAEEMLFSAPILPEQARPFLQKLQAYLPDKAISIEYAKLKLANFSKSDLWQAPIINDLANPLAEPATKIVVEAGFAALATVNQLLPPELYAQLCEDRLILIMHKNASKWLAVQTIAAYFGLEAKDIVAFGDDHNDKEMLKNCGIGVAVAAALEEVKQVADYVCADSDADGVALWLNEHILC